LSTDVAQALRSASSRLSGASPSSSSDAALLLAYTLEHDRAWLIAHSDEPLSGADLQRFETLVERRALGEPVAYLIGTAWFCGRAFEVSPAVLVPRPETEHVVEAALEHLRSHAKPVILDVGTGSGAIACTLAAQLPGALVYATERSIDALALAERNARALRHPDPAAPHPEGVEGCLRFELADLLPRDENLRFDCVVANLPYVPTAQLPRKPEPAAFEPRDALDGGPDGLREYRRLLARLPGHLGDGAIVLMEAAPPSIAALRDLAAAAFPGARVAVGPDYAGLERYIRLDVPRSRG
jgi:release factor glutamine methyltransferase